MKYRILFSVAAKPYDTHPGDEWVYVDVYPRQCACGNLNLWAVTDELTGGAGLSGRVAIACPLCRHTGQDTCHGLMHAIRRWNWHGFETDGAEFLDPDIPTILIANRETFSPSGKVVWLSPCCLGGIRHMQMFGQESYACRCCGSFGPWRDRVCISAKYYDRTMPDFRRQS